jgi:hypothetical protein
VADEGIEQLYNYAMGLAEARSKDSDAVQELVERAGGRPELLRAALEKVRSTLDDAVEQPSEGTDDAGPPEAPALLASRLLAEALESLDADDD